MINQYLLEHFATAYRPDLNQAKNHRVTDEVVLRPKTLGERLAALVPFRRGEPAVGEHHTAAA